MYEWLSTSMVYASLTRRNKWTAFSLLASSQIIYWTRSLQMAGLRFLKLSWVQFPKEEEKKVRKWCCLCRMQDSLKLQDPTCLNNASILEASPKCFHDSTRLIYCLEWNILSDFLLSNLVICWSLSRSGLIRMACIGPWQFSNWQAPSLFFLFHFVIVRLPLPTALSRLVGAFSFFIVSSAIHVERLRDSEIRFLTYYVVH